MSHGMPATGIRIGPPLARLKPAVGQKPGQALPTLRGLGERPGCPQFQIDNSGKVRNRRQALGLRPGDCFVGQQQMPCCRRSRPLAVRRAFVVTKQEVTVKTLIVMLCLAVGVWALQADSLDIRLVGNWPFGPSYAVAFDTAHDLAFVSSGGGVQVVDVSVPDQPVKLSEIKTIGFVHGLCYSDSLFYIADDGAGLRVVSVSDPANPTEVGYCDTPGKAFGVTVAGDYAYVADYGAGLRVISVSDRRTRPRSGTAIRRVMPETWPSAAATPISPTTPPVCGSSPYPTRQTRGSRVL
jgi:hypothetical protein